MIDDKIFVHLTNKAEQYRREGNGIGAINLFKKAIFELKRIYLHCDNRPFDYLQKICYLNIKIGDLYCALNDWENGHEYYQKTLMYISNQPDRCSANAVIQFLSGTIKYKIGISKIELGLSSDAIFELNDAVNILSSNELITESICFDELQYELALAYNGRGGCHYNLGNHRLAKEDMDLSISILQKLHMKLGDSVSFLQKNSLARIYLNYGTIIALPNDPYLAVGFYDKSVSIWAALMHEMGINFPEVFSDNYALALMKRGEAFHSIGSLDQASESLNAGINLWNELHKKSANNVPCRTKLRLAKANWIIGNIYNQKNQYHDYMLHVNSAIQLYRELIHASDNCRKKAIYDFAILNSQLGLFFQKTKKQLLSLNYHIEAASNFEKLISDNPISYTPQKNLSVEYGNIANGYVFAGNLKKAVEFYFKSKSLLENLLNENKWADCECIIYLIRINSNLGSVCLELNDLSSSLLYFRKAAILIKRFSFDTNPSTPDMLKRFNIINAFLNKNNIVIKRNLTLDI